MRKEFKMTKEELEKIMDAGKPVIMIAVSGPDGPVGPKSPQENANNAWMLLGNELGFVWDTVQPVDGRGTEFFTAIVKEK